MIFNEDSIEEGSSKAPLDPVIVILSIIGSLGLIIAMLYYYNFRARSNKVETTKADENVKKDAKIQRDPLEI